MTNLTNARWNLHTWKQWPRSNVTANGRRYTRRCSCLATASHSVQGRLSLPIASSTTGPCTSTSRRSQVRIRALGIDLYVLITYAVGESLPVRMNKGDVTRMGSTIARGEVEATVYLTGMQTFYGKTAALLQVGGDELGELQKLLLHVVLVLLALSFVLCGITLAVLLVHGQNFRESLGFVVVLMVASIPIAMEVVVTATLALGSRELSSHSVTMLLGRVIPDLTSISVAGDCRPLVLNRAVVRHYRPVFRQDGDADVKQDDDPAGMPRFPT